MRVNAVGFSNSMPIAVKNSARIVDNSKENSVDTFEKKFSPIQTINFKGYRIHIIDGGYHADTMIYFARGIVKSVDDVVDVVLHRVETNSRYPGIKQMTSVRDQLKILNERGLAQPGEFVAIPGSAQVLLTTLGNNMGLKEGVLRPDNVKNYKTNIIKHLSSEYNAKRLDFNNQGFNAVPEVITQINELVKKGVNVYIPAGHPIEFALKARAAQYGVKDDLYDYIATRGRVGADKILPLVQQIKNENIYRFNLLALSDAHVVNIKDLTGEKDYIFAAFDNCVNDSARGVFNFYPVRNKEGKILGYSFTDKHSIHYPYSEYPDNKSIENISKFVGRKTSDFCYDGNIVHIMKSLLDWEEPVNTLPDVLYPIDCFPKARFLADPKLRSRGAYFNRDENLFFDMNDSREFTFRKCDCEGSGRPSVVPMWGTCFATINAIRRDINNLVNLRRGSFNMARYWEMRGLASDAEHKLREGNPAIIETSLNKLLKMIKPYSYHRDTFDTNVWAHEKLFKVLKHQKKDKAAEGVANSLINLKCNILLRDFKDAENIHDFSSLSFAHYWDYPEKEITKFTTQVNDIADWFDVVANLAKPNNERAYTVSTWAANIIRKQRFNVADELVARRANGHINIGEIYNEYHERHTF